ncbi:protein YgfX [Aliivibrio kagoshimensis]|uniref:protein YgfX n=1 Tax=Aliivibrio kagoshimensis TaxID=2910230 RepID=UPI003D1043CC
MLPITAASCARAQLHPSHFAHALLTVLYVIVAWALWFLSPVPILLSVVLTLVLSWEYRRFFSYLGLQYGELVIDFDGDVLWKQQIHQYCYSSIVTPWLVVIVLRKEKGRQVSVVIWHDSCQADQFKNVSRVIHSR